ncbi:MAG: dihydroneopterin aldolase [Gammaproteobacteria bacterium]
MDRIFLKDLRVETVVGVWDWEKQMPQTVSIDLEMAADIKLAAKTDKLDDALNYKAVSNSVRAFVKESRFELIETMIEGIANLIMTEFNVPWVKVVLHKPYAIKGSKDVGIIIERGSLD